MANSETNVKVSRPAVLAAMLMTTQTFRSVTPCRLINSYGRFR